jgi:hypothetical protein
MSSATLGPRWVRVTRVEHGHGRSPPVAQDSEEPQVTGLPAQAAGMMRRCDSDCGPEGRGSSPLGHPPPSPQLTGSAEASAVRSPHVCRLGRAPRPPEPRGPLPRPVVGERLDDRLEQPVHRIPTWSCSDLARPRPSSTWAVVPHHAVKPSWRTFELRPKSGPL